MISALNDVELPERVKCEWPLDYMRDIFQARGLFRIQLPDDKHDDTVLLPEDGRFIFKMPFTKLELAEKMVDTLNKWKRRRGGRRPNAVKSDV